MRLFRWILSLFHHSPPVALTMGVSVFCGWANPRPEYGRVTGVQCPAEWPWKEMKTRDRIPALGEYDEREPAITQKRCEWMQQGKIDYACYQVEWAHEMTQPETLTPDRPYLDPLLMAHCADNHPSDSAVKFCLSLWDVSVSDEAYWKELKSRGWTKLEAANSWRQYARTVAERYMTRASYFRVDGRPVLFEGYPHNLNFYGDQFLLWPAPITRLVGDEIEAVTGHRPYLVATCCPPESFPMLRAWGFDAFTEYMLQSDSWPGTLGIYRERWNQAIEICRETGIDYWVPATCGYNSSAWGSPVPLVSMPTPDQFTAHLIEARAFAQDNAKYTKGQVITYAWSEFGEGGILEPLQPGMLHDGDEMLQAHTRAVT